MIRKGFYARFAYDRCRKGSALAVTPVNHLPMIPSSVRGAPCRVADPLYSGIEILRTTRSSSPSCAPLSCPFIEIQSSSLFDEIFILAVYRMLFSLADSFAPFSRSLTCSYESPLLNRSARVPAARSPSLCIFLPARHFSFFRNAVPLSLSAGYRIPSRNLSFVVILIAPFVLSSQRKGASADSLSPEPLCQGSSDQPRGAFSPPAPDRDLFCGGGSW